MGYEYPRGPVLGTELRRHISRSAVDKNYRQLWPGMHLRRDVRPTFAVRTRAVSVQYPDAVLVGWSAALLWNHPWIPRGAVPHAASAMARRSLPGRRHTRLVPAEKRIREVDGMRVADPVATAAELCRTASFVEASIALDGLERAQPGTRDELAECVDEFPRARFTRRVVAGVDAASSTREVSWLRAQLLQAGIDGFRPGEQIRLTPPGGSQIVWSPLLLHRTLRAVIVEGPAPRVPGWRVISVPPGFVRCEAAAIVARVDEVLSSASMPPRPAAGVGGAMAGKDPHLAPAQSSRATTLEASFWLG